MESTKNAQLELVLSKLDCAEQTGLNTYQTLCPAHDDRNPSLTVTLEGKKILVHCHAGFKSAAVVKAIGMKMSDLYLSKASSKGHVHANQKVVAEYDYCNNDGKLLFQVVRFHPKGFRQRKPRPGGGWDYTTKGCKIVPYRLPELNATELGSTIFIAEGEKDVDRLRSLRLSATTNAMGAGKWKWQHAEYLDGYNVVILPDNDVAGRKHAQQVANSLVEKALSIKVVALPGLAEKGDVSDWLDAGNSKQKLLQLVKETPD